MERVPLHFIGAAVLCGMLAAGCSRPNLPATGASPGSDAARQGAETLSTFTLVGHAEGGRKRWQVEGQTADLLSDTVQLKPVRAVSYGRVRMELTAEVGRFDRASRQIFLEGPVTVETSDERMKAQGLGGTGLPDRKRFRLNEQVVVTLRNAQGEITVVTCEGPMEADYARSTVRFWRNVQVRDRQGVIRSDRLDVALDPKTNELKQATFWGHVEIQQKDQVAYANRAQYRQDQGWIRLMGHPKLVAFLRAEGE